MLHKLLFSVLFRPLHSPLPPPLVFGFPRETKDSPERKRKRDKGGNVGFRGIASRIGDGKEEFFLMRTFLSLF